MAIFEELGKKLSKSGQEAAQKAKNLAETVKLNSLISDEEKVINNLFTQIGKLCYESFEENPDERFTQFVADVNEAKSKISSYTDQVNQLKGVAVCAECGGEVPFASQFCGSCGATMSRAAAEPVVEEEANLCSNCSAPLPEGTAFCTGCGTKVEE